MSDKNEKRNDYVDTFTSETGRRVLADLMDTFHMSRSSHVGGDACETAFREGERHAVLHILNKVGKRSDPEWLNRMFDDGTGQYSEAGYSYE